MRIVQQTITNFSRKSRAQRTTGRKGAEWRARTCRSSGWLKTGVERQAIAICLTGCPGCCWTTRTRRQTGTKWLVCFTIVNDAQEYSSGERGAPGAAGTVEEVKVTSQKTRAMMTNRNTILKNFGRFRPDHLALPAHLGSQEAPANLEMQVFQGIGENDGLHN